MPTTELQPLAPPRPLAMPGRPFQRGGTLLLVEDSRQTSDSIRLIFQGAGGRLRRADSLLGARRHLSLYTPDALLIDLGLPDGSGVELIAELARRRMGQVLIIAMSGQPELESAALDAGADAFVSKPIQNVAEFRALLAPVFFPMRAEASFAPLPPSTGPALRDDLLLALDLLCDRAQQDRRGYALQFCAALARSLGDVAMAEAVHDARQSGAVTGLIAHLRRLISEQPLI